MGNPVSVANGRRGAIMRHHPDDTAAIEAATQDLKAARIEAAIERNLAKAPGLRPEQVARLAGLLNGGAR